MIRSAFIITKPLQFMVAVSIIEQENLSGCVDILVVDIFSDAGKFVESYHEISPGWGNMCLFKTHADAYRHARKRKYRQLFIDTDCGIQKAFTLLRQKVASSSTEIIVYEEGVGTYRSDLYGNPIRRLAVRAFGAGAAFGGSVFTNRIYVYDPPLYLRQVGRLGGSPCKINTNLINFARTNRSILDNLFAVPEVTPGRQGEPCNLYLTNWGIDKDVTAAIAAKPGVFFIKPHPHLAHLSADDSKFMSALVIAAGVPAELLILRLLDNYPNLTVFHHGSSAARYLAGAGANFVNVDATQ